LLSPSSPPFEKGGRLLSCYFDTSVFEKSSVSKHSPWLEEEIEGVLKEWKSYFDPDSYLDFIKTHL
jgi:hypothetical protein